MWMLVLLAASIHAQPTENAGMVKSPSDSGTNPMLLLCLEPALEFCPAQAKDLEGDITCHTDPNPETLLSLGLCLLKHQSELPASCRTVLLESLVPTADKYDLFVFYLSCCSVLVISLTFVFLALPNKYNQYQFRLKLHDDPHYFIAWIALTVAFFSVHIPLILLAPDHTPLVNRSETLCYITGFSFPFITIAGGCWVLGLIHYMYAKGRNPLTVRVSQWYMVWVFIVSAVTSIMFVELALTAPARTEWIKDAGAPMCRFTCRGPYLEPQCLVVVMTMIWLLVAIACLFLMRSVHLLKFATRKRRPHYELFYFAVLGSVWMPYICLCFYNIRAQSTNVHKTGTRIVSLTMSFTGAFSGLIYWWRLRHTTSSEVSYVHFDEPNLVDGDGWAWREGEEARVSQDTQAGCDALHPLVADLVTEDEEFERFEPSDCDVCRATVSVLADFPGHWSELAEDPAKLRQCVWEYFWQANRKERMSDALSAHVARSNNSITNRRGTGRIRQGTMFAAPGEEDTEQVSGSADTIMELGDTSSRTQPLLGERDRAFSTL